jgi:DNA-damage-inducible protein D
MDKPTKIGLQSPFEEIKKINEYQAEYWAARDLMKILDYVEFRNFIPVINKAIKACDNSGQNSSNHFVQVNEMVDIGSKSKRPVENYHLSRYACYLIVQNADPSKEIVALGQTYFAVQTHRQEISDQERENQNRLLLRGEMKDHNTRLAGAAKNAGVIQPMDYAVFQNHGYKGLYGGLKKDDIHRRKGLKKSQEILDHMGSTELAANLFRATQTEEKLRRDNVQGKHNANAVHQEVGAKVRKTIKELGGTMPEDLPTVESIQKIEKEAKKKPPKIKK